MRGQPSSSVWPDVLPVVSCPRAGLFNLTYAQRRGPGYQGCEELGACKATQPAWPRPNRVRPACGFPRLAAMQVKQAVGSWAI